MTEVQRVAVGPNEIVRFLVEIVAIFTLGFWGFVALVDVFPWNIVIGLAAPAAAILVWGLFRSPQAVFRLDAFGKALVEIAVMAAAALAWWDLGLPIVAGLFAVVAVVSGIVNGLRELA